MSAIPSSAVSFNLRHLRRRFYDLINRISRRTLAGPLAVLGKILLFLSIAAGVGFGSVWYMLEVGTSLTIERQGAWVRWVNEGGAGTDPYTRAHLARSGRLMVSPGQARYYSATRDSDGALLYGDCEYDISGSPPAAVWWSLGVYTTQGQLIDNPAERYAVTGDTIVKEANGSFLIRAAEDARPGNWLPTGTASRIVFLLRAYLPSTPNEAAPNQSVPGQTANAMPVIKKVLCR